MTTKTPKTDESVKAGLQIEAGHTRAPGANDDLSEEKDADELVHEQENDLPTDSVEQDLDEIVHEQAGGTTAKEAEDFLTEEEDMDDLVHRHNDAGELER
jgi:hypothetical protein